MHLKIIAGAIIFQLLSCTGDHSPNVDPFLAAPTSQSLRILEQVSSIPPPAEFERVSAKIGSFCNWLRMAPLKKNNTVYLYDGSEKPNQSAQFAVLDVSVGDRDLQQCADAVMRLRAEYLFSQKEFKQISFSDNEGTEYTFDGPYTREKFNTYLQRVFGMCGTASLSKQLIPVAMRDMQVGDVLIKGGFPGHAVMVMDMAENNKGEKVYLLAQSYMPAQDIHILNNGNDETISPWYSLNDNETIVTPEYRFTNKQLRTW